MNIYLATYPHWNQQPIRTQEMRSFRCKNGIFWSATNTNLWTNLVILSKFVVAQHNSSCDPVSWSYRICRLHLYKGVRPPTTTTKECHEYDTKQYDGEAPVMSELWEMQNTLLLPLLLGPLWPEVVAPDRVLSRDQIELNCLLMLNWIVWNRTVSTFNCVLTKNCTFAKLNCLK